jgi:hypothetical protein
VSVFLQWVWSYVTGKRGSRLIVDYEKPRPAETAAVVSTMKLTSDKSKPTTRETPVNAERNAVLKNTG